MYIYGTLKQKKFGKYSQNKRLLIKKTKMIKKTRLSFSSISRSDTGGDHKTPLGRLARRTMKSSTYQYSKKGHGPSRGSGSYGSQHNKNMVEDKIPPVEKGVIRIIPLGGVEEVGRNMILIESEDDIIVLDIGFHFIDEEEAMGADFTLPNFKYLEERKNKIERKGKRD